MGRAEVFLVGSIRALAETRASLTGLDWGVLGAYLAMIVGTGIWFSRRTQGGTDDYFLAGRRMPVWAVAISIIATSLSAATFVGVPESSYKGDLTYLSTNIGMILAVFVVAGFFIPAFYRHNVASIYELLEIRFGRSAKYGASAAFLVGRVFASGARIFIAAIPLSILLFGDAGKRQPEWQLMGAIAVLTGVSVLYTLAGGVASVIWTEVFQTIVLLGSVVGALIVLLHKIPAPIGEIMNVLSTAGVDHASKLTLIDPSPRFDRTFSLAACVVAFPLMGMASYGTDHDLVQRMLTCRDAAKGGRSVIVAILGSVPVIALFLVIGLLLFVFYRRPDVMGAATPAYSMRDTREVFLSFILHEMPAGMSGLMIAGLCSVGISSLSSALNAMASTFVRDFYRHGVPGRDDRHYLKVGRAAVAGWGVVLGAFACVCVYWQAGSKETLIDFALKVMTFAYGGLLAVFLTAIFTRRGTTGSAIAALTVGFVVITVLQPNIWNWVREHGTWGEYTPSSAARRYALPEMTLAWPWHLVIATLIATLVCAWPRGVGRAEGLTQ